MPFDQNIPSETELQKPTYLRYMKGSDGWYKRVCINLLLRLLVKWTSGLRVRVGLLRQRQLDFGRRVAHIPTNVRREALNCDGVSGEWLTPENTVAGRVILYIHGGAFVARSPDLHVTMVAPWCRALCSQALMVDYGLAPEHRYPAAIDDVHAAYRWLISEGWNPKEIVLAGDSAGGNLALALLHRLKAAGEQLPVCAVLLSPLVDFTLSGASMVRESRRDPVFTLAFACAIREQYAPPERFLDPTVSPLFGDYQGLPPLLFQVGSTEMLLDDSTRAAARAHAAGVQVELEIWHRLPHVFQALPMLPEARQAAKRIVDFIARHATWRLADQS